MKIQPYLHFNGNCEEAFLFYEKALGGKILMTSRFKDLPEGGAGPEPGAAEAMRAVGEKIMHTRLQVGEQLLMGSDCHPLHPYHGIHGCSVAISVADFATGQKVFDALSDGAKVDMPFGPAFWGDGFGMLTDKFGVPWMVNAGEKSPD